MIAFTVTENDMRNEQVVEQFKLLVESEKSERTEVKNSLNKLADAVTTLTVAMAESKQRDMHFQESITTLTKNLDEHIRKYEVVFTTVMGVDKRVEGIHNKIESSDKERKVLWQKLDKHNDDIDKIKGKISKIETEVENIKKDVTDNKNDNKLNKDNRMANLEKWLMRLAVIILALLQAPGD